MTEALVEARGHSGFWLLTAGFFICGFQVQFIATHLPAYIEDGGLGSNIGATALALIAFFNMIGAWFAGYLGGKQRKKYLLTAIYLARALVIVLFVAVPLTLYSIFAFCAAIGFFWLATVPLTSGLIGQIFGTKYMGTLYSIVYLSHALGSALSAWFGGRIFDYTGNYDLVWWVAVGLSVAAAIMHVPINDEPLRRIAQAS